MNRLELARLLFASLRTQNYAEYFDPRDRPEEEKLADVILDGTFDLLDVADAIIREERAA
jgi:hypothetical protein